MYMAALITKHATRLLRLSDDEIEVRIGHPYLVNPRKPRVDHISPYKTIYPSEGLTRLTRGCLSIYTYIHVHQYIYVFVFVYVYIHIYIHTSI